MLSVILALVMAFSGLSVIGSAALVQGQVAYDAVNDAQLTPEQVFSCKIIDEPCRKNVEHFRYLYYYIF